MFVDRGSMFNIIVKEVLEFGIVVIDVLSELWWGNILDLVGEWYVKDVWLLF